jgi:PAS domain S-box-containing protein
LRRMSSPGIAVLLVDDELEFGELVHFFLGKQHGITVHSTTTARKALEMIDTTEYDAIVSDYMMPEINGIDFLKILRAKGSSVPFILLTGRGREDVAVQALNLGADFYVAKHGDPKAIFAELANAIMQCVEKKAALESLKASERKYRELVELAQEGIWAIDREGRTTLVNAKMAEMLGYDPDEMMGKPFFDFMDSSWREKAAEYFDRRMKGVSEHHEFEFMKKDGTVLHALVGASSARDDDGDVIGGVAVISDLSDRVRGAALLRRERDVAQKYLDIARVMILCIDTAGRVTLVNKRGCEMLGYSKEEIVGKDWFSTFLPERVRSEILAIFDGVLSEEITAREAVVRPVLTKSGEERIVRWHNTIMRDEAGQVTQTLSSGEDVTDAVRMEQELKKELEIANALAELSSILISPDMSIPELSKTILRYVSTLTESEHGFVSSIDPETRNNVCHTLTEMVEGGACRVENRETDIEFPIGADGRYPSLWGVALNRREPFYTNAPAEHESSCGIPDGHIPLKNFLSVPVVFGGDLVGEICAANSPRGYSDKDVLVASRLGELFAVALQRQRDLESFVDAQNRFKMFMDHSSTISFIKDLQGRYVFANREYEMMLGLSGDDIVGKTDLELWPEVAAKSFREADERIMASGISERCSETVELPDGVHEYLTFKFPLVGSKRKPALLGGVSVDVTDMKKRESALELANEKLRILGSLTRHDAINQIAVLEAWLSLLKEDEDSAGFRDPLEIMTVATGTLRKQLEFAGELEHVGSSDPTWVDIQEACANVWDEMAIEGIIFECQCSGFEALVDPLFPKVIRNLVDNTVRHGEGAKRVGILCEETPDGLRLVYEDDGVGIPSEAKGKIFDKGFGANTGFGLYLVRELLKLSDARISEVGERGKGARFEIDFRKGRYRRKMPCEKG